MNVRAPWLRVGTNAAATIALALWQYYPHLEGSVPKSFAACRRESRTSFLHKVSQIIDSASATVGACFVMERILRAFPPNRDHDSQLARENPGQTSLIWYIADVLSISRTF